MPFAMNLPQVFPTFRSLFPVLSLHLSDLTGSAALSDGFMPF